MNRRQALITMGGGIVLASTGGLIAASPPEIRNYLGLVSNPEPRLDLYVIGASSIEEAKEKLKKKTGDLEWPYWSDVSDCRFAINFAEDCKQNKIFEAAFTLPSPYDEYDVVYIVASGWWIARKELERMANGSISSLSAAPYYVGRYFQLDTYGG